MTSESFVEKLDHCIEEKNSLLCVGLDPDPGRLPEDLPRTPEGVRTFLERIIESTGDLVCAYKPNLAFYGSLGIEGFTVLKNVIDKAHEFAPVILDGKFGDIGNTAARYAETAFGVFGADAVTLSPYMGSDSIAPFLEREDRFAFILGITSNRSASEIEKQKTGEGEFLFTTFADRLEHMFPGKNWGWVAGATHPGEIELLRAKSPERWFLVPGVGAQGGDLTRALVASKATGHRAGAVINASRSILYASGGADFAEAARTAAGDIVRRIRSVMEELRPGG